MYKDILQSIVGVEIFPIISLVIFFVFFLAMLYWVYSIDKSTIEKVEHLPLEGDDNDLDKGN